MKAAGFFAMGRLALAIGASVLGSTPRNHPIRVAERLCLTEFETVVLAEGFKPTGAAVSYVEDKRPALVLWSPEAVAILRTRSDWNRGLESAVMIPLPPGLTPQSVGIAPPPNDLAHQGLALEVVDAGSSSIRRFAVADGVELAGSRAIAPGTDASLRGEHGWIVGARTFPSTDDEYAEAEIVLARPFLDGGDTSLPAWSGRDWSGAYQDPARGLLRMRRGYPSGVIATETTYPFVVALIGSDGHKIWSYAASHDSLRRLLSEPDLEYVIATPAISLDRGALQTFVALRSGRRIAAIHVASGPTRFRYVPPSFSFLASLPNSSVLFGARALEPYEIVSYLWAWTPDWQACGA